jgi:hypothetical protein
MVISTGLSPRRIVPADSAPCRSTSAPSIRLPPAGSISPAVSASSVAKPVASPVPSAQRPHRALPLPQAGRGQARQRRAGPRRHRGAIAEPARFLALHDDVAEPDHLR